MNPLIDRQSPRPPAPTPSTLAYGALDGIGQLLDDLRLPARRFVVSSPLVWKLHGERFARAMPAAEPILVPDGERSKRLSYRGACLRRAGPRQRRPRIDAHHVRRRRHRRPGRLRRVDLLARHLARPRPDDAAGAGRQLDRRQSGRQSRAGKEPDRLLLPAARRRRRSVGAVDAAAAGIPRRAVRSRQVRHDVERRRCSNASGGSATRSSPRNRTC